MCALFMEIQISLKQYNRFAEIVEELEKLKDTMRLSKSNDKKGGNEKYD